MKAIILFLLVMLTVPAYSQHKLDMVNGDTLNLKITGINSELFYGKTDEGREQISTDSVNTYFFQGTWHEVRPKPAASSIMARNNDPTEVNSHVDFYQNLYSAGGLLIATATIPILLTGVGLLLPSGDIQTGVFIAAGISFPVFAILSGIKFQHASNDYMRAHLSK